MIKFLQIFLVIILIQQSLQCATDDDCTDPQVCHLASSQCVASCTSHLDCNGQICLDSQCIECQNNGNCPHSSQVCENNFCQGCIADAGCLDTQFCDTENEICIDKCTSDEECEGQVCDIGNTGKCYECVDHGDCNNQQCESYVCTGCNTDDTACENTEFCDLDNNICAIRCTTDDDCTAQVCDLNNTGQCYDCLSDTDCDYKLCNLESKTCYGCTDDLGCQESEFCDTEGNTCSPKCTSDSDCGELKCDVDNSGQCYDCLTDDHCPDQLCNANTCSGCTNNNGCSETEYCDIENETCNLKCTGDSDCTNQVCDLQSGLCEDCVTESDCNSQQCISNACSGCTADPGCEGTEYCDTENNACIAKCTSNSDCEEGLVCDANSTGLCYECLSDDNCTSQLCSENVCTGCTNNGGCQETEYCLVSENTCYPKCTVDSDCTDNDPYVICDKDSGECVECIYDEQCHPIDGVTQVCHPTEFYCLGCTGDWHCDGQVCNTDINVCFDCLENCEAISQVCDTTTNECVECISDDQCSGNTDSQALFCNLNTNTCIQCQDNNHCASNATENECKKSTTEGEPNVCVECLTTSNCPIGQLCQVSDNTCQYCLDCSAELPACREVDNSCVECISDDDCTAPIENRFRLLLGVSTPVCDTSTNTCVQCDTDKTSECTGIQECNFEAKECQDCGGTCGENQYCNVNVVCSECTSNDHCAGSFVCDTSGDSDYACVECTQDSDCTESVCQTSDNTCQECLVNTDCIESLCAANLTCQPCGDGCGESQVCDTDGITCVECTEDIHCSGACSSNTCVECTDDSFCTGNEVDTKCETGQEICVECLIDDTCIAKGAHLICTDNNECKDGSIGLECDNDSECYNDLVCNTEAPNAGENSKSGTCRSCQRNHETKGCAGFLVCNDEYECVAGNLDSICDNDSECSDGLECDLGTNTCQSCYTNDFCVTNNSAGFVCYENGCSDGNNGQSCTVDAQCSSGTCNSQSQCSECEVNTDCNTTEGMESYVCTNSFECVDGSNGQNCSTDDECILSCITATACGCSTDDQCTGENMICDSTNDCKDGSIGQECSADGDCINVCDTENSLCVECNGGEGQCNDESLSQCGDNNTCVQCTENSQCDDGKCIENECVISIIGTDCTDNGDCDSSNSHLCDNVETNQCQLCVTDGDCSEGTDNYCHQTDRICVECTDNENCTGGTCNESSICVLGELGFSCSVNNDCDNLLCDTVQTNTCQECFLNEHCTDGVCVNNVCTDGVFDTVCNDNGDDDCLDTLYCQTIDNGDNLCKECDDNTHTCGDSQVCQISNFQCVECLIDIDCEGDIMICTNSLVCKDGSNEQSCSDDSECINFCHNGTCKDCSGDENCDENQKCNDQTQVCVQGEDGNNCNNDSYCLNRCLVDITTCVECLNVEDCGENQVCSDSNICVDGSLDSPCTNNTECLDYCETTSGACKICIEDTDCDSENNFLCTDSFECVNGSLGQSCQNDSYCLNRCNLESNECVVCIEENDCTNKSEVCSDSNVCTNGTIGSVCDNSSECFDTCDVNNNICTSCLQDSDCQNEQVCDNKQNQDVIDNECVECFNDTHCTVGECFEFQCRTECQTTDDCPTEESPVCNDKKLCVACSQSTDCYKFADTQICDPQSNVCIAELQIDDNCCEQPSDLITNSDPATVESFLEDSPIISLVFEIQTETYKQTLYFVQLLVDGVILQPQSVDNSTIGQLVVHLDSNDFQKGKDTAVKVFASYKNQNNRRVLQDTSSLIKFEKQVKLTDKSSIQGEQAPVVQETTVEEKETDYLYLYILIPVAIVFMLAIGLIAYKGGQKKQQQAIQQKNETKKQTKYIDTENLDIKDDQ